MERKYYLHTVKNVTAFKKANYPRDTTCQYALQQSDGVLKKCVADYCHGELQGHRVDIRDPVAVLNQVQNLQVKDDVALRYYEWLFNYSPFRSVFVTKSAKRVLDRTVMVADCEKPRNLMVGGLIASRLTSENYSGNYNFRSAFIWDELVKRGLHPNAAFVTACALYSDDKYTTLSERSMHHMATGKDDATFYNFFLDRPVDVGNTYRKNPGYSNLDEVWRSYVERERKPKSLSKLGEILRQVKQPNAEEIKNPFAPKAGRRDVFSAPFNEAIEEIALQMKIVVKNIEAPLAA